MADSNQLQETDFLFNRKGNESTTLDTLNLDEVEKSAVVKAIQLPQRKHSKAADELDSRVLRSIAGWKNMDYNWRSPVFTRLAILVATVFVLGYSLGNNFNFIATLVLIIAIAFQGIQLLHIVDTPPEKPLEKPIEKPTPHEASVKYDDVAQFFKNIVQHVGIGILTFNKEGAIQIINTTAKRLLRVDKVDKLDDLRSVDNSLVDSFLKLKTGGARIVTIEDGR